MNGDQRCLCHPGDPFGGRVAWEAHRAFLINLADSAAIGGSPSLAAPRRSPFPLPGPLGSSCTATSWPSGRVGPRAAVLGAVARFLGVFPGSGGVAVEQEQ